MDDIPIKYIECKLTTEEYFKEIDVEEGRLREVLGLDTDKPLHEQVDSAEELANMAVDAVKSGKVSRDDMASMLALPANFGEDPNNLFSNALSKFSDKMDEE